MPRATLPKIVWGDALEHTITFGQPLDDAVAYPLPRQGSEWGQVESGARDAWVTGDDERLRGTVRHIPTVDSADPPATGWDGVSGWGAFLKWARGMNVFRWHPDAASVTYQDCYLVEPLQGQPALEQNGDRVLELEIEDTAGNPFTGY